MRTYLARLYASRYFAALRGVEAGAPGDLQTLLEGTATVEAAIEGMADLQATLLGTSSVTATIGQAGEVEARPCVMPTPIASSQGGRMAGQVRRIDITATLAGSSSLAAEINATANAAGRMKGATGTLHARPSAVASIRAHLDGAAQLQGQPTFLDEVEEIAWLLAA